ncbi:MAG: DnaJ domain-containing protein [Flavipsychrobacter sp.]|nr:DnaJ domain-containing protein [Flavipsychrobacter sp.]
MPAATLKDYYKTLELLPSATADEVKKAYRTLAFKYHPDTNPDNTFAHSHFLEIQEAYGVLSHEHKRRKYDEERWLNGMSSRTKEQQIISPEWILLEARKLHTHMKTVDTYRMSHSALYDYIMLLLGDSHMAILQQDAVMNTAIVNELLHSTHHLKHQYMLPLADRMAKLVPADNELLHAIYKQQRRSYRQAVWEKYLPVIIILTTLLLCCLMIIY